MLLGPRVSSPTALRTVRPQEQGGSLQGPEREEGLFQTDSRGIQRSECTRGLENTRREVGQARGGKAHSVSSHSLNPPSVGAQGAGVLLSHRGRPGPQGEASSTQG